MLFQKIDQLIIVADIRLIEFANQFAICLVVEIFFVHIHLENLAFYKERVDLFYIEFLIVPLCVVLTKSVQGLVFVQLAQEQVLGQSTIGRVATYFRSQALCACGSHAFFLLRILADIDQETK